MGEPKKSNHPTVVYHVQVRREGWWYTDDVFNTLDDARKLAGDRAERHGPRNVRIVEWTAKVLEVKP